MIFIDTGAFLARFLEKDQHHSLAKRKWSRLKKIPCVTSNHVIDETLTLLARRAAYPFAAARAKELYASKHLRIECSQPGDEIEALQYFEKFADQLVSFTDCISFAMMKRIGAEAVFSFDKHFALAGFKAF